MSRAVLICGSRNYTGRDRIAAVIRDLPHGTVVITGGQKGADTIAHELAMQRSDLIPLVYRADWTKYGKAAGPIRNRQMLERLLEFDHIHVYAFPMGGPGTANMLELAYGAGVQVTVHGTW